MATPGINEVNYFPSFSPMTKDDPRWESGATHCMECQQEFHFILKPKTHCTVCGITFCKTCCHSQQVYNGHCACGGCVANAMMIIKTRYDEKRRNQVRAHFETHHKEEAAEKKKLESNNKNINNNSNNEAVDELYGKTFDALLQHQEKKIINNNNNNNNNNTPIDTDSIGINE
eukprot:Tbor_TRINITY_DN6001_c4_g1::TRINITY_DN6001_c4_g1_i1::g.11296::m.11296